MLKHVRPHVSIFIQQPLAQRDLARFGISALIARDYAVSVFDVSNLAFPMLKNTRDHYTDFSNFDLVVIKKYEELQRLRNVVHSSQLTICYVGSGYVSARTWPILRLLSVSPAPYLLIAPSTPSFVHSNPDGSIWDLTRLVAKAKNPLSIVDSVLSRTPLWLLGLRPADFVVVPALKSDTGRPLFPPSERYIPAHVMDYDLYLEENSRLPKPLDAAVFIDQNFGFHPDIKSMFLDWFDADEFYHHLRLFFDRIESELGLEVVIAAHPRGVYDQPHALFGNRRIFYSQTPTLIRNGQLMITAYSTSIAQAILHEKLILFYTSSGLSSHPTFSTLIQNQSQYFGSRPCVIDKLEQGRMSSYIYDTRNIRESFIPDWIKHPNSPPKPHWDIILDFFIRESVLPA